jgi:hypothetical protein
VKSKLTTANPDNWMSKSVRKIADRLMLEAVTRFAIALSTSCGLIGSGKLKAIEAIELLRPRHPLLAAERPGNLPAMKRGLS